MRPLIVINVVGLTPRLLGPSTPHLSRSPSRRYSRSLAPAFPAVTCTAQSSDADRPRLRGSTASSATAGTSATSARSGSGGSRTGWSPARRSGRRRSGAIPAFTCANLFWWYNMYSSADISVTPRPMYLGRRPQAAGLLHHAARAARRADARARARFRCSSSGARRRHRSTSSRWIADAALHVRRTRTADADARLPAASRLRPAAARARTIRAIAHGLARGRCACAAS